MAMRNDNIKVVLDKEVKDDPVMHRFLDDIYTFEMDPKSGLRYKAFYKNAIENALKEKENENNV